jgi:hypothetical protein
MRVRSCAADAVRSLEAEVTASRHGPSSTKTFEGLLLASARRVQGPSTRLIGPDGTRLAGMTSKRLEA